MKLPSQKQRGYILLVLMLFVAVLAIGMLAMVERIDFQIKRDREEELIHRGVQYSRAVRRYFKKFGRYPTRFEDLESTNHLRFLRKRYKDPVTGKDFKPLHMTDVQISFNPAGAPEGAGPDTTPEGTQPDQGETAQQNQPPQVKTGGLSQIQAQGTTATGLGQGNTQVFGGGAIIGVASVSKNKTIREFNKKDHYNQWQFIYDPTTDRGGLLMTPNQPPLQGAVQLNQQPNEPPGQPSFGPSQGVNTQPQQPQQPNPSPDQQ